MKSLNRIILAAILLLINFAGSSQPTLSSPSGMVFKSFRYISDLDRFNNRLEEKIGGTPYYEDSYAKGKVYTEKGYFSNIEMRYNIFNDQIEFKKQDSVHAIGPDPIITKIQLGNKILVVDKYENRGQKNDAYFLLLDSGRITLVAKMVVDFREREPEKPMQDAVPPRYERKADIYYYKVGNGPLIKIGNIKKMIESLPDHKKEMEAFGKKEKISVKDPEELGRFVRYYD